MREWNPTSNEKRLARALLGMRKWASPETPINPLESAEFTRLFESAIKPVLSAIVWPRWLLLERALRDAASTGDLLFASLVMRTMCEELQRLAAIDLTELELKSLIRCTELHARECLALYMSVLMTSMDDLTRELVLDGTGWPSLKLIAKADPALERARASLNSYVHPNYGSHIVALYPEQPGAARLLLEAIATIYAAFFKLSWAEAPILGKTRPLVVNELEPWGTTISRLEAETIPEIRRLPGTAEVSEVLRLPSLLFWLRKDQTEWEALLQDPEMATLLHTLPQSFDGRTGDSTRYNLWDGARACDVLRFASARLCEQALSEEFANGAPDALDQIGWLNFQARSLELAMIIDAIKAAAFQTQLVRQVVQGNVLGIFLCIRSLVEHQALARWLPMQLCKALDDLAIHLRFATPLPVDKIRDVEQPLANFLATKAKGSQSHRPWVLQESGGIRLAWLNLTAIISTAYPSGDAMQKFYAVSSAAAHGRSMRGVDVLRNPYGIVSRARRMGLLILEAVCNTDAATLHLGSAFVQSLRMRHAAKVGGTMRVEVAPTFRTRV